MKTLYLNLLSRLQAVNPEEGQDLIEYALLVALIALICIAAITLGGTAIQNVWNAIAGQLNAAVTAT